MEVIDVNNVHQALPEGCRLVLSRGVKTPTRNGSATVLPTPLTTIYRKPTERVLFWPDRDANPFFHLFECIWMMVGRRDVAWLAHYNSKIGDVASDDGVVFNGAYGHRWRQYFGFDQLKAIIDNLKANPNCRRQVLTMWSASDLANQQTKDVPCNTQAFFQIRGGELELMVTNRSNDLIWGAYGANAVHFSFLLEVVAFFVGVQVGKYYQVSMNTHLYERFDEMAKRLAGFAPDPFSGTHFDRDPYFWKEVSASPVVTDRRWFADAEAFMEGTTRGYTNPFFPEVCLPLNSAWTEFKEKKDGWQRRALDHAEGCRATDWRRAATEWLSRRIW